MAELIAFSEEQELIANSALELLRDRCGFDGFSDFRFARSVAGLDGVVMGRHPRER